ncbi:unnamed protein product [Ceratitis capitata]|uniref:(Mediterranean fruit fly) hypothetical protein n=1 Tax=Ceratitis capitata TaxID=7213 RepID=A0A811VH47_CERCA|nr:unnamed protein product [Ceratitis capitata]
MKVVAECCRACVVAMCHKRRSSRAANAFRHNCRPVRACAYDSNLLINECATSLYLGHLNVTSNFNLPQQQLPTATYVKATQPTKLHGFHEILQSYIFYGCNTRRRRQQLN